MAGVRVDGGRDLVGGADQEWYLSVPRCVPRATAGIPGGRAAGRESYTTVRATTGDGIGKGFLFNERQEGHKSAEAVEVSGTPLGIVRSDRPATARREDLKNVGIVMEGEPELLEGVATLRTASGFARGLNRG